MSKIKHDTRCNETWCGADTDYPCHGAGPLASPGPGAALHVFERAGLGKAPYEFISMDVRKHQACAGAPVAPGAACDYCATGIMECYRLRSADGREFIVGSDCIRKAGDAGLSKAIAPAKREHDRVVRAARQELIMKAGAVMLVREDVRAHLAELPHPYKFRAEQGLTLLDWIKWNMARGGKTGRTKAYLEVLKASEAIGLFPD